MANSLDDRNMTTVDTVSEAEKTNVWHLNALTEALGDLTLNVSDSLSVGRGSDNDVVLGSKQVSRNHALLSVLNGELYVKDLASSNGTFINDARIDSNKSEHLEADDTLGFASFSFQVMKPIAVAGDGDSIEQPVKAEAVSIDSGSAPIDVPPTAAIDAEVVNDEVVDAKAINSEVVNSEIINDNAASPVDEPEVSVNSEPAMSSPAEPVVADETVIASIEADNASSMDNTVSTTYTDEPVVKETIIEEVLSSTAESTDSPVADVVDPAPSLTSSPSMAHEQETVMSNDTFKEPPNKEPPNKEPPNKEPLNKKSVSSKPVASEPLATEPAVHQEPTMHQQPIVTPEHDKTTKTELQEEADPDVLRAKQAATGQLSGTANLGQSRDLGTEGNNAMDQAIDNSANAGHVEKKPSGGWFIWVFITIIIIGLALWLFNMGA